MKKKAWRENRFQISSRSEIRVSKKKKRTEKIYNSAIRARGLFGIEIAPPPSIVTNRVPTSDRQFDRSIPFSICAPLKKRGAILVRPQPGGLLFLVEDIIVNCVCSQLLLIRSFLSFRSLSTRGNKSLHYPTYCTATVKFISLCHTNFRINDNQTLCFDFFLVSVLPFFPEVNEFGILFLHEFKLGHMKHIEMLGQFSKKILSIREDRFVSKIQIWK